MTKTSLIEAEAVAASHGQVVPFGPPPVSRTISLADNLVGSFAVDTWLKVKGWGVGRNRGPRPGQRSQVPGRLPLCGHTPDGHRRHHRPDGTVLADAGTVLGYAPAITGWHGWADLIRRLIAAGIDPGGRCPCAWRQ